MDGKGITTQNHECIENKMNPINEVAFREERQAAIDAGLLPNIRDINDLIADNPKLQKPVISGLVREGEICNIIAQPKTGKSWLTLDLAISVALGIPFLGTFKTSQGKVLILDNELHAATLAQRVPTVCLAKEIDRASLGGKLSVDCLRGRLVDLVKMKSFFGDIEPGEFKMIVLDAFYRFLPSGTSENDNGQMMGLYNILDCHAKRLGCCFILIHHSSKGNQSGKSVTDTGAGAGSMARATDCHMVIRKHANDGLHVLDAAVRSAAPVKSISLRFDYPLWHPDETEPKLIIPRSEHSKAQAEQRAKDVKTICLELEPGKPFGWVEVKNKIGCGESRARNIIREGEKLGLIEKLKLTKRKHGKKKTMTYMIKPTTTGNDNGNEDVIPPLQTRNSNDNTHGL